MDFIYNVLNLVIDYYPFFGLLLLSFVVITLIFNLAHLQKEVTLLKEEIKELK